MDTNSSAYALGHAAGTMLANGLLFLAVGFVVALVVFLIVRWFWLWYWRVNVQVALLQEIAGRLARIEGLSNPDARPVAVVPVRKPSLMERVG